MQMYLFIILDISWHVYTHVKLKPFHKHMFLKFKNLKENKIKTKKIHKKGTNFLGHIFQRSIHLPVKKKYFNWHLSRIRGGFFFREFFFLERFMCKPLEIETNLSEEFLYEKCFCVGIFFLNQVSHHSPFFFGGKMTNKSRQHELAQLDLKDLMMECYKKHIIMIIFRAQFVFIF